VSAREAALAELRVQLQLAEQRTPGAPPEGQGAASPERAGADGGAEGGGKALEAECALLRGRVRALTRQVSESPHPYPCPYHNHLL
jgi:hypothetical protein